MEMVKDILIKKEYKPFQNVTGFSVESNKAGCVSSLEYVGENPNKSYKLTIDKRCMTPRDGLLMTSYISEMASGKKVLDLGTGSGVLAIHSAIYGASSVVGVDIDKSALEIARENGDRNNLSNISWLESDLFLNVPHKRFDLILSNPPQLPMGEGHVQDTGGLNGKRIIEKIISQSPRFLSKDGALLMVLFDFLGVDTTYSNDEPLKEMSKHFGFKVDVLTQQRAVVRKGGETEKAISHILIQYPKYRFESTDGETAHHKLLVRAQLEKR